MNNVMRKCWSWCLLAGGAVLLWALGYDRQDPAAITFMALLVISGGARLVLAERQKRD